MIEYIEHYKSRMGVRIYYVGMEIHGKKVAKIINTSLPYPDEQSCQLLDSEGNRITEIYGGTITEKYDRSKLKKALKGELEYIKDMMMEGKHIGFSTGSVKDAFFKRPPKSESWEKYKERCCIG